MSEPLANVLMSPLSSVLSLVLHVGMAALLLLATFALLDRLPVRHVAVLGVAFGVAYAEQALMIYAMRLWQKGLEAPATLLPLLEAPLWQYVALALLVLACCVAEGQALYRWRRAHVTPTSIKEALDGLAQGVCLGDEGGACLLSNLCMEDLSRMLTGHEVTDLCELWDRAREQSDEYLGANELVLRLEDRSVWMLRRDVVEAGGVRFLQVSAADVSEVHRLTNELRQTNARLREHQERIRAYGLAVREHTREREVLEAKAAVHDQMGHVLLYTRHCLEQPGTFDQARLVALWQHVLDGLLRGDDGPGGDAHVWEELADVARSLGIHVRVEGALPVDDPSAALVARALRECVTNVAKHARGSELLVRLSDDGHTATFTNDGDAPREQVLETGGLRTLRQMVEAAGGSMEVTNLPAFSLTLRLSH